MGREQEYPGRERGYPEENTFKYEIKNKKAVITGYTGHAAKVEIPGQLGGYPVAVLAGKAFLGQKGVQEITVPPQTEEIGDWAFARCGGLVRVTFRGREIRFGKGVFRDCGRLEEIRTQEAPSETDPVPGEDEGAGRVLDRRNIVSETDPIPGEDEGAGRALDRRNIVSETDSVPGEDEESGQRGEPELLAAAVTRLNAPYLLELPAVGSREWLAGWDAALVRFLRMPEEGDSEQTVCGEEDYAPADPETYAGEKRKEKVRLAFLRLLHPRGLQVSLKNELEDYLRGLTKGCGTQEAWQVIREEYGGKRQYYALFAELGCINERNFPGILDDIGEDCPEMKAFFLNRMGQGSAGDLFQELEW